MSFEATKVVHVYYKPQATKILVGRLTLESRSRKLFFEYDSAFLNRKLNLSPFMLPLQAGTIAAKDFTFDGLFGVFNDSLPDGWGRLLLDRTLVKHRINPGNLSVLDRLCFVGHHGMGALLYEPKRESTPTAASTSLDEIAQEIIQFQQYDDENHIEDLLRLGGSSAGARPKALLTLDDKHWIIKFPSITDFKDIAAIEYAYYLMAKEAGLNVPPAKLFPSRQGFGFFASLRFDINSNQRVHIHSLSGLLHADHRIPNLDYEMIMKATLHLTHDIKECEKQFRQCAFNILAHNRDDHGKNFSFLMDEKGAWRLSPAYDLTFSSGPSGEHCSTVMGEGKNPGLAQLQALAKKSNINASNALDIIGDVKLATEKWPQFAKEAGVSQASEKLIQSTLKSILKENF